MTARLDLEDTFGDIIRKASNGTKTSVDSLSQSTGIDRSRLNQFMADKAQPDEDEVRALAKALGLSPNKLVDSGLRRWYPKPVGTPDFLKHQINAPQPSNGYFLLLSDAKVGAVVDPAGEPSRIIDTFARAKIEPQYILVTHKHADHSDALAAVRTAFPRARPVISEIDAREVGASARDALNVRDGDSLPFGDAAIEAVYTPGHTDGSICFLYKGMIFAGDVMFAGSVGRTFGPRTSYKEHLATIRSKILALPGDTVVLPGHGPASTIAQEQAHNPFF